jgi:4-hydroxy-2-oxoheptanedioate aldolase
LTEKPGGSPYASSAAANVTAGRATALRTRFLSGQVTFGAWCAIPSSFSAELLAAAGFDWICIDMQHGLVGYNEMVGMLQAADAHNTPALVRVSAGRPELIMAALDAGATGVVVPLVSSPEEARHAVAACRYPPLGTRSWGPARASLRNTSYTPEEANDSTICVVMIETPGAASQATEILSVPGVDGTYIGPWDLSLAIHHRAPEPGGSEADRAAIETVRLAAESCGVTPGIACGGLEHVRHWLAQGFKMIAVNSDVGMLVTAAASLLEESRKTAAEIQPAG